MITARLPSGRTIPLDRRTYTTGQIAGLLEVAPRTVGQWIDSGRLPGYRIPGSGFGDRRVTREAIIRFCREKGMPCPLSEANRLLVVDPSPCIAGPIAMLGAGWEVRGAATAVAAAAALIQWRPSVVLIDTRIGLGATEELAALAATVADVRLVVALVHEDGPDAVPGCTRVVRLPCPPELLLDAIGVGGA